MLEISITLVAGFAAYTAYVIAGDEIRANRAKPQLALKQPVSPKPPSRPAATAPKPVAPSSAKPSSSKPKPKPIKANTPADPIANTAKAIMANLTKNGPATLSKLSKELNADETTLRLAAEKLINDKKITSIKRGGHPALALYNQAL
jgi:N-acetyl-beta-hexosaminidase